EHEVLAPVNIFLRPKSGVHPWISPVDLEFLDSIVQRFIYLLQSAITELVYFIEPHDHLNPVSVSECNYHWRVYDCVVMLELKSSGLPSRFGEEILLKMNLPDHRIKQRWRWRHLVPVESIHHPMLTLNASK
ncbi:hypothetical protein Tco_0786734, partial [Tanacetum coccineum]